MMMMIFICLIRVYTLLISQLSNNVRPEGEADSAAKYMWMDVARAFARVLIQWIVSTAEW